MWKTFVSWLVVDDHVSQNVERYETCFSFLLSDGNATGASNEQATLRTAEDTTELGRQVDTSNGSDGKWMLSRFLCALKLNGLLCRAD